jgi:hypothetical protein
MDYSKGNNIIYYILEYNRINRSYKDGNRDKDERN